MLRWLTLNYNKSVIVDIKKEVFIVNKSLFRHFKGALNGALEGTKIITDPETGVQFLFVYSGYAGGLTLLVDKDGKPLIDKDFENSQE